jgi:glycosyltransferase involved in cell wall biosynthesis
MRFHVVGLPHCNTTHAFSACAFTSRVRKFASMMTGLGHTVYLYAGEQNEAPVEELITCISEAERLEAVGDRHFVMASFDCRLPHWRAFNARAIAGIRERAEPRDFICVIGGHAHRSIAEAFPDMMTVEFSIGYGGTFSRYRIWESYAWMHLCYGAASGGDPNSVDGRWFDAVIPGSFDPNEFPFRAEKDDYFLYLGRLTDRKGVRVAVDTCRAIGARLILAGQGDPPAYGEYVGVVEPEARGQLLAGARALFVPTIYIEPFGNVAVEAQLCGTPVLSTDWGAMTETVLDGETGYRCRTLGEFVRGALTVDDLLLDPAGIRDRAIELYSTEAIGRKYDRHFRRLSKLWGDGWYDLET